MAELISLVVPCYNEEQSLPYFWEQTAAVMKALAKSKLEKALQDNDYAQGSYATEMEQTALLAEAKANRKQ